MLLWRKWPKKISDTSSFWWKERHTKKNEESWNKTKDLIRSIANSKPDGLTYNYDEKYMKIKFNLDDDLPLKKTIEFYNIIVVAIFVLDEANKYYSQLFLD